MGRWVAVFISVKSLFSNDYEMKRKEGRQGGLSGECESGIKGVFLGGVAGSPGDQESQDCRPNEPGGHVDLMTLGLNKNLTIQALGSRVLNWRHLVQPPWPE
jgi:hypothetical protein